MRLSPAQRGALTRVVRQRLRLAGVGRRMVTKPVTVRCDACGNWWPFDSRRLALYWISGHRNTGCPGRTYIVED